MANAGPITVLVDTREQKKWSLDPSRFVMERATLRTGDYTVKGLEDQFILERKSLGDAVGTFISDWLRFRRELYRLAAFNFAAIIVEADVEDVLAHRYESDANPMSVIGRAHACYLDHGVPVFFWGNKSGCVTMVESLIAIAVKKLGISDGEESWASPTVKIESSPSGNASPSRNSLNNGSLTGSQQLPSRAAPTRP